MKKSQFSNGDSIPAVGLGTWKAKGSDVRKAVKTAIEVGYRHIDTAAVYDNEEDIGAAINEVIDKGIVKREELFITSKLWNDAHESENVLPALKESLNKLNLDYLDLYLIHWPVAFKKGVGFPEGPDDYISLEEAPIIETWIQMVAAKDLNLCRHIGVSNFSTKKLSKLISQTKVIPEMNQVELHPLLQQQNLYEFCDRNNILLTAYSPLGSGDRSDSMKTKDEPSLMEIDEVSELASKYGISEAKLLIAWHVNRGNIAIPKSTSPEHMKSNLDAANLKIESADMKQLSQLDRNYRFITGKFFEEPKKGYENIYDE